MTLTYRDDTRQWRGCMQIGDSGFPSFTPRWLSFAFALDYTVGDCLFLCSCALSASSSTGCADPVSQFCAGVLTAPIQCSPFEVNLRHDGGGFTNCPTTPPFPLFSVLTE
jgi:hypothetical protein